ncbi:MAG: condensation domain-containing protein, partial [Acidobacteriota bacterium]
GFRIELGEVEAALAALPEVAEAAAGVRGTEAADRRLVAWVVPSALGAADPVDPAGLADALRRALKERLPSSMIPSAFVVLEALPRTPSGKVDRKALPEPDPGKSHGIRGATAPRTPLESALAGIFAELLGVPFPGIEDDFFALGGHSLLAMRAISRVREAFGVEIPLRRLFEEPTVAALGRAVEAALIEIETGRGAVPLPPVEPVPRAAAGPTRLPLSAGQEQLWFVDRLEPGDPSFNLPSVARLRGALVPAALGRALAALVTRHEVLRTAFETGADGPSQVILPPDPPTRPPLPLIDVSGLPPERREPEARRWAAAEGRGAFDLGRAPLLRASLVRLAPEEHLFLLTVHHIVSDGRSQEILLADLEVLYDAARAAPAGDRLGLADAGLPAQALQYADYAVWQRRVLRGEALDRRLAYWRGRLGGTLPELRFPGEGAGRPAARSGRARRGEVRMLPLEGRLLERLRSLARAGGGTLFMTLLAAFAAWLHRVTGATDLLVGTPSANRGRTEVEDLVGFFVNTLVLRTDLTGDPGFLELAGRVREEALGAFTHADLPFESLVAALQPERSSGRAPLFRVLFALNPVRGGDERTFADLTYEPVVEHNGTSQFDLSLYAADRGGDVLLFAEYDAALFGPGAGDRILDQVRALLDEVAGAPERRLSELARGAALEPVRPAGPPEPAAGAATTEASETGKPAGTARATDPARRDRLAARRGRLSPEQRAALARRLRGAAERGPGGSDGTAGALPGTVPGTVPAVGAAGPSLVPLQPAGDAPPLFLVHPAGGDVLCFAPLAEQLALLEGAGRRRPVYGVQSRGLVDGFEPHAGIEEMAAGYLEEIGRLVPSGPVHLAGWSLGGVVAFEMARRARADAASGAAPDVALLAVLDTVPDVGELLAANASADGEDDDARWLMHIVEYAEGLSGRRLGLRHETLAGLPLEAQLARLGGALQATGLLPAPTGSTGSTGSAGSTGGAVRYLARLLDVFKANCRAVAGYRPGIYPGPITLFRTGSDP